jgi:hypothetical protein
MSQRAFSEMQAAIAIGRVVELEVRLQFLRMGADHGSFVTRIFGRAVTRIFGRAATRIFGNGVDRTKSRSVVRELRPESSRFGSHDSHVPRPMQAHPSDVGGIKPLNLFFSMRAAYAG